MDARFAKLRADDVFLEMIEAHLFARHLDPLTGEKGKEKILHAFGWILAERFVEDPCVVGIDVKSELLAFAQAGSVFLRDAINNLLDGFHVGGINLPGGVLDTVVGDVFAEQSAVSLDPFRRLLCVRNGDGRKQEREKANPAQEQPWFHGRILSLRCRPGKTDLPL